MQKLPIEYFTAKVTRYHDLLQWIEFRGGQHWLRMSEPTCGFKIGLAAEEYDINSDGLQFFDKLGRPVSAKIKHLSAAPEGFQNFEGLPTSKKSLLDIELDLKPDSHAPYPITLYMPAGPDKAMQAIFTVQPSLLYPDFLFDAVQNYGPAVAPKFDTFVETGTLYGHTSIHASYLFDTVYTIELSDDLYNHVKPIETVRQNLKVLKGSSETVLPKIIKKLSGPTVFFLDAHWSGDSTVDFSKGKFTGYPTQTAHSGKGDAPTSQEQKPIIPEFEAIYKNFKHPALLIIDDWDLMGVSETAFEKFDWSHLSKGKLMQYFADSPRTIFHHRLGETRYVVGLSAK